MGGWGIALGLEGVTGGNSGTYIMLSTIKIFLKGKSSKVGDIQII